MQNLAKWESDANSLELPECRAELAVISRQAGAAPSLSRCRPCQGHCEQSLSADLSFEASPSRRARRLKNWPKPKPDASSHLWGLQCDMVLEDMG